MLSKSYRARQAAIRLFGATLMLAGLAGFVTPFLEAVVWIDISPKSIKPISTNAYYADLSHPYLSNIVLDSTPDSNGSPQRSGAVLHEDGISLKVSHSSHSEISEHGLGRYSHWNRGIYFSTSDNSDPRVNGRTYSVGYPVSPSPILCILLLVIGRMALASYGENADLKQIAAKVVREAAAVSLVLGLAALLAYVLPSYVFKAIDSSSIRPVGGYAYVATLSDPIVPGRLRSFLGVVSDSMGSPSASRLHLYEQGIRIGIPHSMHQDIAEKGSGSFSHWGAEIIFSTPDNSNPNNNGRYYSIGYPISLHWWLPITLIFAGVLGLFLGQKSTIWPCVPQRNEGGLSYLISMGRKVFTFRSLYVLSILLVILINNWILFKLVAFPVPSPDSHGYLVWSLTRTPGYPAFLEAYQYVFDSWAWLSLVQLNIILVGVIVLSLAIAKVTKTYFSGWLFLVIAQGGGMLLLYAPHMLTEAIFSGLIMLHLGSMILYFYDNKVIYAVLAGLTIAAAVLFKSVAVVFIGPLALLLLFMPMRRRVIAVAVCFPAVAAFIVPSIYIHSISGVFQTSVLGGYAFAGHVAWGIHPYPGSKYPEEASQIERRLQPVLALRPNEFKDWHAYVDYTTNEYNSLLWGNIVPELAERYRSICKDTTSKQPTPEWGVGIDADFRQECYFVINRVLSQLTKEAIKNNPMQYARHVLYHYWGLWKFVFNSQDVLSSIILVAKYLPNSYLVNEEFYLKLLRPTALPDMQKLVGSIHTIENSPLRALQDVFLLEPVTGKPLFDRLRYIAELILLVSLLGSLLVFWLKSLDPVTISFSYTALVANAYFLGQALAQPAMYRYAGVMQGVVTSMLVLGLFLLLFYVKGKCSSSDVVKTAKS